MDKELEDLFEIGAHERNDSEVPRHNIIKFLGIRIGVLAAFFLFLVLWANFDHSMGAGYAIVYACIGWPALWLLFMLLESIILHFNKKRTLRNASWICIVIVLFFSLAILNSIK